MPIDEWSEAEARSFWRAHDGILFEPATGDVSDDAASDAVLVTASDTASQMLRLARMRLHLKSNQEL
jgi:hypothetical protein